MAFNRKLLTKSIEDVPFSLTNLVSLSERASKKVTSFFTKNFNLRPDKFDVKSAVATGKAFLSVRESRKRTTNNLKKLSSKFAAAEHFDIKLDEVSEIEPFSSIVGPRLGVTQRAQFRRLKGRLEAHKGIKFSKILK